MVVFSTDAFAIRSVLIIGIILYTIDNSMKYTESKELRFLGLLPMSGGWSGGRPCLQAINMAVKHVNAREDILQNYEIDFDYIDTKCNPGIALYQLYGKICSQNPYILLIGDGCSIVSEATAQMTHLWNLTQLSYGSVSPVLADRTQFPNFYRLTVPDHKHNPVRIALMRQFNWKKVATINQALQFFSSIIDDFVKRIIDTDITILSQEIFTADPTARVKNLKDRDARIIIGAMYEDKARDVLCAAYKIGLYGPKIVWMFPSFFTSTFWKQKLDRHGCTESQMKLVVEGIFLTVNVNRNPVDIRGIANITVSEFDNAYINSTEYSRETQMYDVIAPLCYDTIWVAASALHCADQNMIKSGMSKSLENFTYADGYINDKILDCMEHTVYTGVSGDVVFRMGDPDRLIRIDRIQDGKRAHVGLYRRKADQELIDIYPDYLKWKDGEVPRDSTLVTYEEIRIPSVLYYSMTALAVCGNCLTLGFFVFNIIHKKNSYVKLSSPNINNVLLFGCLLCYSTVFFRTIEVTNDVICKIRIFFFGMGFTTSFGAMFSKTWRVYRIFTNKKLLRFTIKDSQLYAIVVAMVMTVVVVIAVCEAVGPYTIETKYLEKEIYLNGNDAEVRPYVRTCKSDYSMYFGWTLYIIEGVLLTFGAFLAWETRHVKIQALNDSHQIGLCVYNVVVLSAVGVMLSLVLEDKEVVLYGVTSGCLILGTTLTQLVIFIPKIQAVRNKISSSDQVTTGLNNMTIGTVRTESKAVCSTSLEK
ncbi:gamma-aminobutyric acid type B receptor subunit 1-like [Ruditapes philippinarum]|uniref:gamma-aminobutyric acid type B receptor subunit 1-like n=1 Tax=Ruditapes philippinarum TaxID=129788 RepID=UPI00295B4900|nr:gamma-aminobutyric acid type B receptor subunit 1-like [Ruditapes philippinarum]